MVTWFGPVERGFFLVMLENLRSQWVVFAGAVPTDASGFQRQRELPAAVAGTGRVVDPLENAARWRGKPNPDKAPKVPQS